MWNQWTAGPPPMPPPPSNSQPLIGPIQPTAVPTPSNIAPSVVPPASYSSSSGAPSYTPAQYAAMTPEQQFAVQQHWQQWQAYEQQYAQWHAQYGEQYKREMAAIQNTPATAVSPYAFPPPAVSNAYQAPPAPTQMPPPPPPEDNNKAIGVKVAPQIYEQPPPPPPPKQQEDTPNPVDNFNNANSSQFSQPPELNRQNTQFGQQNQSNQLDQQTSFDQDNLSKSQERQQQNNSYQSDRQRQNQYNQERQQQNQFQQRFNNNNQRGQQNQQNRGPQRDEQGRQNWQGNRQNNDFRGRNRGRGGNNFDNNRQQQFDDSESTSLANRNNRINVSNRFDSSYENFNKNMGQTSNQAGSRWNNNTGNNLNSLDAMNQGNNFNSNQANNLNSSNNQRQQQNSQNQSPLIGNSQNSTKTNKGVDEKAFDEQFRLWEEQFENWKKENANHPDRTMYMQYEREFEKTRTRLLERREQMRRRKMMEMKQSMPQEENLAQQLPSQEQQSTQSITHPQPPLQQLQPPLKMHTSTTEPLNNNQASDQLQVQEADNTNIQPSDQQKYNTVSDSKQCETSDMEQSDAEEDADPTKFGNKTELNKEPKALSSIETPEKEENVFKKQEITEIFKTDGGIPGLDLVGSKDGDTVMDNPKESEVTSEIIDLENDGPTRPPKVPAFQPNQQTLNNTSSINTVSQTEAPFLNPQQQQQKKIPSLFDIVVEKPILSPESRHLTSSSPPRNSSPPGNLPTAGTLPNVLEARPRSISKDRELLASPGQRPLSQASSISQPNLPSQNIQQQSNIQPQAADLAKALQDPNVMQLLTAALAQAQQAGGTSTNLQTNVLLQQLKQLQPLLQMQNQNYNNQSPNNSKAQDRQQQWQHDNRNFNSNFNNNFNQNRNSFGGNPFNRNNDSMSFTDDLDGNNEQKNPRNPFRRNNIGGSDCNDNNFRTRNFGNEPDSSDRRNSFPNNPFGRQTRGDMFGRNDFRQSDFDGRNMNNNSFGEGMDMHDSQGNNFGRNNLSGDNFGGGNNKNFNFDRSNFNKDSFNESDANECRNLAGRNNFSEGNFGGENFGGGNFGGGNRFDNKRQNANFGNSHGYRSNQNNFGDNDGNDSGFYRPAQIFDYQNRSKIDTLVMPTKVVDYGHKPSASLVGNSFNQESEFVPVKTIDYGHASSTAPQQNQNQLKNNNKRKNNRWNQELQNRSSNPVQQQGGNDGQDQNKSIVNQLNPRNSFERGSVETNNEQNQPINTPNKDENLVNEDSTIERNASASEEVVHELEDENSSNYPKNSWVLQNPELRQRPGLPTKRGNRKPGQSENKQEKNKNQDHDECEEIEENFEEISDSEEINEIVDNPSTNSQKEETPNLFPSVSHSIKKPTMVFPSMENNNTIPIDEILFKPGRLTRPKNIVIIIRGPPGSGKSHVAKLIKEKEIEMGGQSPRLLSIDDYFMVENDYEEKCPKTGRKIPKKEILYEYEKDMEATYMQYLIKSFKKTVSDHLYDFIIVDCWNHSLRTFNEFYNAARDGNFSPFVIDMKCDLETCLDQNIHSRKEEEIKDIIKNYQDCPGHYIKLDVSNLLENVVEMEDVSDLEDNFAADSEVIELDDDDEEEEELSDNNDGGFLKSKWDTDPTTANLARLDGTSKPISKRGTATLEEYLQIDGWEPPSSTTNGKKRVRWADIEEKRAQDKMRAIGFVVGQTDWNRMMDPTSGSGALTKTKYIERINKRR